MSLQYFCLTEGCCVGDCPTCRAFADLRSQLADALEWRAVYEPDVRLWQRMYQAAVSIQNDEDLGTLVRETAHDYYYGEKARMEARIGGAA